MTVLFELAFIPLFTQAILYGLYLATFIHCLRWILFDDEGLNIREKISWQMLSIVVLFFVLMTAIIGIQYRLAVGPALQVDSLAFNRLDVVISGISIAIRLIFDAVLIMRCWVVWEKSWRVTCLPLLLWISCLASAILLIYNDWLAAYAKVAQTVLFAETQQYRSMMLFYTCNIATNVYATSAIVYRIIQITRLSGSQGHLRRICRVLVESGTPYMLTSVLVLAAVASGVEYRIDRAFLRTTSGTINYSIASISFNLIIIRISQNRRRPRNAHSEPQYINKTTHP